jgi:truncated hemoglobin YjbI
MRWSAICPPFYERVLQDFAMWRFFKASVAGGEEAGLLKVYVKML